MKRKRQLFIIIKNIFYLTIYKQESGTVPRLSSVNIGTPSDAYLIRIPSADDETFFLTGNRIENIYLYYTLHVCSKKMYEFYDLYAFKRTQKKHGPARQCVEKLYYM
jgi:hypothetical protein